MRIQKNDNFAEAVVVACDCQSKYDESANNSSKTWTVPDNEEWKLRNAYVSFTSSATVGNRILTVSVLNEDGNLIMNLVAGAVQVASVTREYVMMQGIFRETAFTLTQIHVPIPIDLHLDGGWSVKFWDSAAIDATHDDMTVAFQYATLKGWG